MRVTKSGAGGARTAWVGMTCPGPDTMGALRCASGAPLACCELRFYLFVNFSYFFHFLECHCVRKSADKL